MAEPEVAAEPSEAQKHRTRLLELLVNERRGYRAELVRLKDLQRQEAKIHERIHAIETDLHALGWDGKPDEFDEQLKGATA